MKKLLVLLMVCTALAVTGTAFADGASQTKGPSPTFGFWDGNGTFTTYAPSSVHDVLTPSGAETEVFKGTIANGTGQAVIYTANSGPPIPTGQTCFSFTTGNTTPDWQLTISASGNFTLTCHFSS